MNEPAQSATEQTVRAACKNVVRRWRSWGIAASFTQEDIASIVAACGVTKETCSKMVFADALERALQPYEDKWRHEKSAATLGSLQALPVTA